MRRTRKTRGIPGPDEHIDTLGELLTQLRTCLTEAAGKKGTWSELVRALEETVRLSNLRYRGGLDSYLQVLDAQRNLFAGELGLARLRLAERLTVVQLYRAVGGGWR